MSMSTWVLIGAVLHILGILTAIKAVMGTRTSQGAIAWAIFLITFPYIALLAYWILGRSKFKGYSTAKQIKDEKIEKWFSGLFEGLEDYTVSPSSYTGADAAADKLASIPRLRANNIDLLIDGDATFKSILDGIKNARSYILFQFYIIKDDTIGQKIKEALIVKAQEGIKVYVLYDEIGSYGLSRAYIKALETAGVKIHAFHTQKGIFNRFQINFRNHRKIVVVDRKYAWIGGHNIGDEYLGKDKKIGQWRDTHIRIEGPAVLAAQLSFAEDWSWATDQKLEELNWSAHPSKQVDQQALIVPSGPADRLETAALMFLHAINSSQKRIWIATPYFVPDDAIMYALQLAVLRGVDVRILIPAKADHLLVYLAGYTYFEEVAQTGVRFFRYTEGFLHEKVMLIDEEIATVGTANFDNRSFRLNFEITCIVKDKLFTSQIEKMFIDDFAHSSEVTPEDLSSRSFGFRLATRLARLTAPIQ